MPPCDLLSLAVWLTVGLWAKHAGEVDWPEEVEFYCGGPITTNHRDGSIVEHGVWYGHAGRDCIASVSFVRELAAA